MKNLTPTRIAILAVLLFVAAGTLLSQTEGSHNMQFLGNLDPRPAPLGGRYSSCWGYTAPDGREYALLGTQTGTSIIDITDAPNNVEVSFIPGPNSGWREMKTYLNYAYIVSDQGDSVAGNGVQIVDLSTLPDSASLVNTYVWMEGTVPIPRAHTVSAEGKYLYLNGGNFNGIRILDLTDPVNPTKAGEYIGPYIHDSYVRNDTVYGAGIGGVGVDIIDVRNKSNPERIKLLEYPNAGTHNAWTSEDGKYLFTTDEVNLTPKTLKIWDIRDIQNPIYVTEYSNTSSTVHNVFIKGNLAYVAWYADGIKVIDISNPANPKLVGYYDTLPGAPVPGYIGAWGAYPYYPSGKVIVSDMQTGLYVLKYSDDGGFVEPPLPPPPPASFSLSQNFPNPFNPETTIQFDLAVNTFVDLRLFDLLGNEIRTLRYGVFPTGTYTVTVDASNLPSGMYIYKLETLEYIQSRRMTVVR